MGCARWGKMMRKWAVESGGVDSAGRWTVTTGYVLGVSVVLVIGSMAAADVPASDAVITAEHVVTTLNRSLAWYRQARVAMRSLEASTGEVFTRDDQQIVQTVLRRAFDTARAEAALVGREPTASPQQATAPVEK